MSIYTYRVNTIEGQEQSLEEYKGQVLLIVNVASRCGFTKQYEGLEKLYKTYKDEGFAILAFPCNQFAAQEPGSAQEIKEFCQLNYNVTFPLFSKIEVNGQGAHPLYVYLKGTQAGIFGIEGIKWNFTKFLISREGIAIERFAPNTVPSEIESSIQAALKLKKA